MSEIKWVEVPCTTNPNAQTFANGVQDFPFSIGRPNAWVPRRSYFRFQLTLKNNNSAQPRISDNLALADNVCGNLYTNLAFKMGGVDASNISTGPQQCSALNNRITKTQSWLKSVGVSGFGDNYLFADRVAETAIDKTPDNIGSALMEDITFKIAEAESKYNDGKVAVSNAGIVTFSDGAVSRMTLDANHFGSPCGDVRLGDYLVVGGGGDTATNTQADNQAFGSGRKFKVVSIVDNGNVAVEPYPATAITATTDYYWIRKNTATTGQSKNTVYAYWQPPLGIMRVADAMPAGDYRFTFTPSANYRLAGVETYGSRATGEYTLEVNDVRFYACMVKEVIPEGLRVLNLVELSAQTKAISTNLTFTVPPSTFALTFFIQDISAGNNPAVPPSKFKSEQDRKTGVWGDTTLRSIQCTYANITKPPTQVQANFGDAVNTYQQLYLNTYYDALMLGGDMKGDKAGELGGIETMDEWLQRGPFYSFLFRKDREARDTEARLDLSYDTTLLTSTKSLVWCVAWVSKTVNYTVAQGMITELSSRNV